MLPTQLQSEFIPAALSGRDIFACADTGSGKTAAYALPALQKLLSKNFSISTGPRVVVVVPLFRDVWKIGNQIKQFGKFVRYRLSFLAEGLSNAQQQEFFLDQETDILVSTPAKLISSMQSGRVDFNRLELLVFDEAQALNENDMLQISRSLPRQKQTIIVSNEIESKLEKMAKRILQKPVHIRLENDQKIGRGLRHYLYACDDEQHKFKLLVHLLRHKGGQLCVVVGDDARAENLKVQLRDEQIDCLLPQKDTLSKHLKKSDSSLSEGRVVILTQQKPYYGIGFKDINNFIHFDTPQYPEQYLQRVAPLAKNQQCAIILLASSVDANVINSIEHLMGYHFTLRTVDGLEPQQPFYRPKIKLKRDHLGRIIRRPSQSQQDNSRTSKGSAKQKSGHLRMLRRAPKSHS